MSALLEVENLTVRLPGPRGLITIVDGLSFEVPTGQVFGLAGESGSGKSMTGLALLRLLPPRAELTGRVVFNGQDLVTADQNTMGRIRGKEIAMVFQDPMTSLHPMLTIGKILTAPMRHHDGLSKSAAYQRAAELLDTVRIPDPEGSLRAYPHQFSGGMRQRIAIASALVCGPKLLIADEPTTALDVTVQAGILRLLDQLRQDFDMSVLLITHDLGVMSSLASELTVMYAGRIAESGPTSQLLTQPMHPYTVGLIGSLPQPEAEHDAPMHPIPGSPPSAEDLPSGCALHPRCPVAVPSCALEVPTLEIVNDRRVACPIVTARPPELSTASKEATP